MEWREACSRSAPGGTLLFRRRLSRSRLERFMARLSAPRRGDKGECKRPSLDAPGGGARPRGSADLADLRPSRMSRRHEAHAVEIRACSEEVGRRRLVAYRLAQGSGALKACARDAAPVGERSIPTRGSRAAAPQGPAYDRRSSIPGLRDPWHRRVRPQSSRGTAVGRTTRDGGRHLATHASGRRGERDEQRVSGKKTRPAGAGRSVGTRDFHSAAPGSGPGASSSRGVAPPAHPPLCRKD